MRGLPNPASDVDLGSLKVIWIEPTSKCNLECIHCYSSASMLAKDDLTVDDWVDVLSQASETGCRIVQIAGGEPTLFDGLVSIVEKARGIGFKYIVLFTNATLLTESDLDELSAYNIELVTSFYSHVRDVHDAITQRQGSFERTVRGIRSIVDSGLPLEVSMVRMPQNNGQVEGAIEFLVGLGVKREKVAVGPVREAGRAAGARRGQGERQDPYAALCGHCTARHLVVSSDGSV